MTDPGRGDVVLYAAISLDGFLAEHDGSLDFLSDVAEAEGYEDFYRGVDALVMGRSTYEVARSVPDWPYEGRPCVVVTSRPVPDPPDGVIADDGSDLAALVSELTSHGRVWLVGGGRLARPMLAAGLLDELDLTVTPHVLGRGIALWGPDTGRHRLELVHVGASGAGTARLRYLVRRP